MGKVNSSLYVCKGVGNTGGKEFGLNYPEVSSPEFLFLDFKLLLNLSGIRRTETGNRKINEDEKGNAT